MLLKVMGMVSSSKVRFIKDIEDTGYFHGKANRTQYPGL